MNERKKKKKTEKRVKTKIIMYFEPQMTKSLQLVDAINKGCVMQISHLTNKI